METINPATNQPVEVRAAIVDAKTAHFSPKNEKLGRILNYSTLPGAGLTFLKDGRAICNVEGTCAGVCSGCEKVCYARRTVLQYKEAAAAYAENTKLIREQPGEFFSQLASKLRRMRKQPAAVRFHVAGEFEAGEAGQREYVHLCNIAREFPDIKFYGYTKRVELLKQFRDITPNNLVVNISVWHDEIERVQGFPVFAYDDGTQPELATVAHCPAVRKDGTKTGVTCDKCRRCIDAKPNTITAVYAH